jgi:hypothetical protein
VIKKRKRVHGAADSVAPVWQSPALDGPFAGLMEKIMSKSNDSSKLGRAPQVRELQDDELHEVSGGGWHQSVVEGQISALRVATSEVFELNT